MLEPAPDLLSRCLQEFIGRHLDPPWWAARAPGRVNVIGEHTDYLGGLCLPLALTYATWVAASPRADDTLHFTSSSAGEWIGSARRHLGEDPAPVQGWASYMVGALRAVGHEGGLTAHVESSVPLGAGLSSSAALICAVTTAVTDSPAANLVKPSIWAEQVAVGAPTGGMDQCAALLGEEDHVLLLDFSAPDGPHVQPRPWYPSVAGLELLVVDTRTRHANADGAFAARRTEGELAMALTPDALSTTPDTLLRRRRHVETENERVRAVAKASGNDDWRAVGHHLTASHHSLRSDYEVSTDVLDTTVEAALAGGAWGARMTGAGFGGSVVVLSPVDSRADLIASVTSAALRAGHRAPRFLSGNASGPATRIRVAGP